MKFTKHSTTNHVFGAPNGWDHDTLPCNALPVTLEEYGGQPAIASFWKPNEHDLKVLNSGGLIQLHIIGCGMPPVNIEVVPADINQTKEQ